MVRCFVAPCSLAKVTTRFMESLHFFQKKFGLSPSGKSFSLGEFFFFYISLLKSLSLVLNPGAKLDVHRGI